MPQEEHHLPPVLFFRYSIEVRQKQKNVEWIAFLGGQQDASCPLCCRPALFRLPTNWRGVYQLLQRDTRASAAQKTEEQARRVAWRLVRDWVAAQVAFVQAGQAGLAQLMLPHALDEKG